MVKITINDNVSKLKQKSKAKNTQDKYEGDWLKFTNYCQNKYLCNPLDVDDLDSAYALTANYMDWLHEDPEAKVFKGSSNIPGREKLNNNPYSSSPYKASTIQRILASITYKYRMNGFQFDRKHPDISETIASIQINQKNIRSGEAKELLKDDIIKIIDSIPEDENDFRAIRDKALILLGFYSFCRRSEILGMKFNHLEFLDEGIQILIPFSKTDQIGEGRYIFIAKKNDKYCPVNSLKKWLEIIRIENEDPLFYSINKSNKFNKYMLNKKNQKISLSDSSFVKILKNRAQLAGLNEIEKISGHSLRRGAISEARRNDLSINDIKAQSGHKSSQMIDLYSKVSDIKKTSVTKKI
mgnify:CR=1 FL=1